MPTAPEPDTARTGLALVTPRALLSGPALTVFAIVSTAPNLLFDVLTERGPALAWLIVAGTATAVAIVLLLVSAPLLLRPRQPRVASATTLLVIGLAALAKSLIVAVLAGGAVTTGLATVPMTVPAAPRFLANIAFSVLATGIACGLVSVSREHRERRIRLVAERQRLVIATATMAERLRAAEDDLRRETHEVLDPALAQVRDVLGASSSEPDADRVLIGLAAAVTEVVRPMSQRYALEGPEAVIPEVDPAPDRTASWLAQPVDVPAAIRPLPIWLLSMLGLLVWPLVQAPAIVYAGSILVNTIAVLMLLLVRRAWPAGRRLVRGSSALAVLVLLFAIVFASTTPLLNLLPGIDAVPRISIMAIGYKTILATVISVAAIAAQQRRAVDDALVQANTSLARLVSTMRRELWTIRRRMSVVLHGSVQSALVSAMLLLGQDERVDPEQVRVRIDQALAAIDLDERDAAVLSRGLAEIRTLWAGVTAIRIDAPDDLLDEIDGQPGLAACCTEIIREAVSNAVRHGSAGHVDIAISGRDGGLVEILVRDDGRGVDGQHRSGLGSHMLEEVCLAWQRRALARGTELRALIA